MRKPPLVKDQTALNTKYILTKTDLQYGACNYYTLVPCNVSGGSEMTGQGHVIRLAVGFYSYGFGLQVYSLVTVPEDQERERGQS